MPTAEKVRDRTLDTIDVARERAEDLVSSGAHGLSMAVNRAVDEVRERKPDIELPSIDVHTADSLVHRAANHKVRTALIVSVVLVMLALLVKRMSAHGDEPVPSPTD